MKIRYGLLALGIILFAVVLNQVFTLRKAHSSFENYYAFRGCTKLLSRTSNYGICKTSGGDTIKIVQYKNKWYLDGDLPWACLGSACFGI